jgi:predicted enzyme related to lactoylglutathione lyase
LNDVTLITYTVTDIQKAKQFFREIVGSDPYVDSPQYVGYKNADMEIGLIPKPESSTSSALPYWSVSDIAASVRGLEAAGGTVVHPVSDVGYGLLVASVKDPNGATIGLRQFPKG